MVPQWLRELLGKMEEPVSASLQHLSAKMNASASFVRENNEFAMAMYASLRQQPGNLFFSPFSIRTALAMTEAGARGETAVQMKQALCISPEASQDGFIETLERLNAADSNAYEMAVANSIWAQNGAVLLAEYVELITQRYGGALNLVDFRGATESARRAINRWVEDKTRQKIRELVPPGALDALTRLVLVNAIYFKGLWERTFDEERTRKAPFYLDSGGTKQADMMFQHEDIWYTEAKGFQAVQLPYQGGDIAMLVLLPDQKDGLLDLEEKLSAALIHDSISQMRLREVKLFLPRFKITWGAVNLREPLGTLGLPLAFTSEADFSGINGEVPPSENALFVSAVLHKAFVEVNEEGTEAAAATAVSIPVALSAPPSEPEPVPVFRADHPFLIAIRDRKSGALLFLGRIMDPTLEN